MKTQTSQKEQMQMSAVDPNEPPDLGALFDGHIGREFADLDVDASRPLTVHPIIGANGGQAPRSNRSDVAGQGPARAAAFASKP